MTFTLREQATMQVFYNDGEQAYAPAHSFFTGRFTPYPDVPGRTQARPALTLETPPPVGRKAPTAMLGCPALIVQDGGYHIPSQAPALQSLLEGLDFLG